MQRAGLGVTAGRFLFEEHAQNGSRPRRIFGRVPLLLPARDSALCAFREHTQNGSRPRRTFGRVPLLLPARDSALCALPLFALIFATAAVAQTRHPGAWTPPRTPDGHPLL